MLNRATSASQALSSEDSTPQVSEAEDAEYAALEATLRSSELGRRFLADYARQHPTPEVKLLLDAVARLETASQEPDRRIQAHGLVSELVAMSETISEMRREICALNLSDIPENDLITAPCAFEQILEASAQATSDILTALEEIQNVSTALREKGIALESCDRLDERAVDIYTACARREIAGQKTADVLNLLRDVERRVDALIEDWSDHETQNLLDAAKALDVGEAFEAVAPGPRNDNTRPERRESSQDEHSNKAEKTPEDRTEHQQPVPRRANRLVPQDDLQPASEALAPAHEVEPEALPANPGPLFDGPRPFASPEPLTLEKLIAAQRTALFG
ncbi:MAG: hypothetical protein QNJ62_12670 [Methyloceanibacter sp.]|nr:hypothetical protein [Methyloceanibacter sp.]